MTPRLGKRLVLFLLASTAACRSLAVSLTFSNSSLITINDSSSPPTRAAPYPSSVSVTGLTGQVVRKATVTISGFTHGFPSDVTILLVSPAGHKVIIMSEVGGQNPMSVTNLTITLDDDATNSLPVYSRLSSGVFKPTNGYQAIGHATLPYDLPAPAPAPNSNCVSRLSLFNNSDPTGIWNLFVVDDATGESGAISNGWTLKLEVAAPLGIIRQGANVVISWPASAQNASLQSAPSVTSGWGNVTNVPVQSSNHWMVTNTISGATRFYRLLSN